MSAVPKRITARLSVIVCAALMASSLGVATAPPARGVALMFVLFTQDGRAHVMRSDGTHAMEIEMEVDGESLPPASRDFALAMYAAEVGINEVLGRLNRPRDAAYPEIIWHNPLVTGTRGWRLVTDDASNDGFPALPTVRPAAPTPIAFVSDRDGDNEIYTIEPGGTGLMQLTDNDVDDTEPTWTPDGRIVFTSHRDGDPDIYVMDADGTNVKNLTNDSLEFDSQPDVSVDGAIVFTSERGGNQDIWMMATEDSAAERLTDSYTSDRDPAWSPTGDLIFFSSGRDGDFDVYPLTTDGAVLATLTHNRVADHVTDTTFIPPPHVRKISMAIDRRGTVIGRVRDTYGMPGCYRRAKVFLQRRTVNGWQPVAETRTDRDGRYRLAAKATAGDYRVRVLKLKPPVPLRDIVCTAASARS